MGNCNDINCIGVDAAQRAIDSFVKKGIWGCLFVSGDGDLPFAYTVGLSARGCAELIIVGYFPPDIAKTLVNGAGLLMVREKFKAFEVSVPYLGIANAPTRFVIVSEQCKQQYMVQAFNYFGNWNFNAQQLVWPDMKGKYPWEHPSQFDEGEVFQNWQPILNNSCIA